jgi:hypothetical protein
VCFDGETTAVYHAKGLKGATIVHIPRLLPCNDLMFDVNMVIGIGSSSAISTSKIMMITAIRKNRDENGSHAEFFGQIHIRMGIFFLGLR